MPLTLFDATRPRVTSTVPAAGVGDVDLVPVTITWQPIQQSLGALDAAGFRIGRLNGEEASVVVTALAGGAYEVSGDIGLYPDESAVMVFAQSRTVMGVVTEIRWSFSTRGGIQGGELLHLLNGTLPAGDGERLVVAFSGFPLGDAERLIALQSLVNGISERLVASVSIGAHGDGERLAALVCVPYGAPERFAYGVMTLDSLTGDVALLRVSHAADFEELLAGACLMVATPGEAQSVSIAEIDGKALQHPSPNVLTILTENLTGFGSINCLDVQFDILGRALNSATLGPEFSTHGESAVEILEGIGLVANIDLLEGGLDDVRGRQIIVSPLDFYLSSNLHGVPIEIVISDPGSEGWQAISDSSWARPNVSRGAGSTTLAVTVDNFLSLNQTRTGHVYIAGWKVTILQDGITGGGRGG
jgi:hypothetical protein